MRSLKFFTSLPTFIFTVEPSSSLIVSVRVRRLLSVTVPLAFTAAATTIIGFSFVPRLSRELSAPVAVPGLLAVAPWPCDELSCCFC